MFQLVVGIGPASFALYAASALAVEVLVAWLWWRGVRSDDGLYLQLGALPLATVIVAPHALAYELTSWLAVAWLLLRYTDSRPGSRLLVYGLCLLGWTAGNLDVLNEWALGFPVAALVGVAGLALIATLYADSQKIAEFLRMLETGQRSRKSRAQKFAS